MISLDPDKQTERNNYKLLIGSIIPRPVAFVTTLSKDGVLNGAPFSYFNIVTADPPMVSISVQRKNGILKDTSRNIVETGSFVVHIADEFYVEKINQSAANLPPEQSEVSSTGLTRVESKKIKVPGVTEAKIRMECILNQAIPLGGDETSPSCDLIIGQVVCFHIDEKLYQEGRINMLELKPVSRLAGNFYSKLGEMFALERPN